MKSLIRHRQWGSFVLTALMIVAVATRLYISHNEGFDASAWDIHTTSANGDWLRCNCPICHAEDLVATVVETVEYNPIITTFECEFAIAPTKEANRIVITSSLRGPPALS